MTMHLPDFTLSRTKLETKKTSKAEIYLSFSKILLSMLCIKRLDYQRTTTKKKGKKLKKKAISKEEIW